MDWINCLPLILVIQWQWDEVIIFLSMGPRQHFADNLSKLAPQRTRTYPATEIQLEKKFIWVQKEFCTEFCPLLIYRCMIINNKTISVGSNYCIIMMNSPALIYCNNLERQQHPCSSHKQGLSAKGIKWNSKEICGDQVFLRKRYRQE